MVGLTVGLSGAADGGCGARLHLRRCHDRFISPVPRRYPPPSLWVRDRHGQYFCPIVELVVAHCSPRVSKRHPKPQRFRERPLELPAFPPRWHARAPVQARALARIPSPRDPHRCRLISPQHRARTSRSAATAWFHLRDESARQAWEAEFCARHLAVLSGNPEEVRRRLTATADELRREGDGAAFTAELLDDGAASGHGPNEVSGDVRWRNVSWPRRYRALCARVTSGRCLSARVVHAREGNAACTDLGGDKEGSLTGN